MYISIFGPLDSLGLDIVVLRDHSARNPIAWSEPQTCDPWSLLAFKREGLGGTELSITHFLTKDWHQL